MSNAEYKVNTEVLATNIQQLKSLHEDFPATAFSPVESAKEIGDTHSKILDLVSEIEKAQQQLQLLIITTADYLQGVYNTVTQGDAQSAAGINSAGGRGGRSGGGSGGGGGGGF